MKRLSKIVLALGLVLFGLSGLAGCSNPSGDEGNKTEDNKPKDAVAVDFTQTTIPASTNTYPAKASKAEPVENPKYVDSTQSLDTTLAAGTPVKSSDNIITVTPVYDGLLIHVDYNATEESKWWKHNAVRVQNVTDEKEVIEVTELKIEGSAEEPTSDFLYKFTEKGKKYKIWLAHQGNSQGEWGAWGETKNTPAHVTAIGGYGEIDIRAEKLSIEKGENDNRIFTLENFYIARPSTVFNSDFKLTLRRIRIQREGRWEENDDVLDVWKDFEIDDDKFTITDEDETFYDKE